MQHVTAGSQRDKITEALVRAQWQPMLFPAASRAQLAKCVAHWDCRRIRVAVHRNHAIEPVTSAAAPYSAWNRLEYEWMLGPYDDSLALASPIDADVHVVWLDTSRRQGGGEGLGQWLCGRLASLRQLTTATILVAAWPLSPEARAAVMQARISDVHVADLGVLADELGPGWLDARTEAISGTRFSNRACIALARELACRWLPAAVLPSMKCVALDLDGTLYRGILGEDGPHGVELMEGHSRLQQMAVDLRAQGVLLALVSRNEREDVDALFATREDFPLRLDDFAVVDVSWSDKADAIARIAAKLRIGLDAIVVVDDNPGELAAMAAATAVMTVHARENAFETVDALLHVAGMSRWRTSTEDRLRDEDLRATTARDGLRDAAVSSEEYLRSLDIRLEYFVGASEHVARSADLSRKTNQFNLSLRRLSETDIARRIDEHPGNVVAIGLADKLSDSGIVGVLVGACRDGILEVDEIAVSCRALGRKLEDEMLTRALLLMGEGRAVSRVSFRVARGPRNAPAREWLAAYLGCALAEDASVASMPYGDVAARNGLGVVSASVHRGEVVQ